MQGLPKHSFPSLEAFTSTPADPAETPLPADCTAIYKSFHRKNKSSLTGPLRQEWEQDSTGHVALWPSGQPHVP